MNNKIWYLVIILFFFSCTKEEPVIEKENEVGKIIGYVKIFDEFNQPVEDCSGIKVVLEGSSPELFAQTTFDGKFEIDSVPTSNYNLIFSKDGFGEVKRFNFQFISGNVPFYITGNINLRQISSTTCEITNLEQVVNDMTFRKEIIATCEITPYGTEENPRCVKFFIDTINTVSSTSYLAIAHGNIYKTSDGFIIDDILDEGIDENIFISGQRIFVVAHGIVDGDNGYFDYEQRVSIFPSLNQTASNIYEYTIP